MIRFPYIGLFLIILAVTSFVYIWNNSVVFANNVDLSVTIVGSPHCDDGVDNDNDGLTDHPLDLGCASVTDENEIDPPPEEEEEESSGGGGSGSGGGGGGASSVTSFNSPNSVIFKGVAYPGSKVTILKNGVEAAHVNAGPDANFEIKLSDLPAGTYVFGTWARDSEGRRSSIHTFTVLVTQGITTTITGIFVSPTIAADKMEVRRGDVLNIFGQGTPNSDLDIIINSETRVIKKVRTNALGIWLYKFDTLEIEYGEHSARSRLVYKNDVSPDSRAVAFRVGTQNIAAIPDTTSKGDLNKDSKVNLQDFSMLAYWYKRPQPKQEFDLNKDGVVNLSDFSILAFYWTG